MDPLDLSGVGDGALLLIDSAPIIYFLENHPQLAARFYPVFEGHRLGRFRLAITTIAIAEVLTGPLQANEESLARRYKSVLDSWRVIDLTSEIAEGAARLRGSVHLKLADAVQAASALSINADALVTYDRDFSRVRSLRVLS
jgi:predicted nucleic acid-binding protein